MPDLNSLSFSSTSAVTQPGAPATPAVSPATLVARDRNLAKLISDYASPGTRSMPVGTRWRLDEARKAAALRGIHPNFAQYNARYADEAFARLEHGQLTEQELLSEFMLRLARARLPAKYPESEGKRTQLAHQMAQGMCQQAHNPTQRVPTCITLLLDAAYGTLSPAPTENTNGDSKWAKAILQVDTLRYCLHTFLCDLATGTHDLGRLETLARHCASQTGMKRRFWYAKLAFFAAHFGAWRSVRLLLDAGKLRPDKLGEGYDIDESRIYAHLHDRRRERLIEEMPPGTGNDHIGLLHLAAAQDKVDMLPFLVAHLTSAGVSIDYPADGKWSALFYAARHGNVRAGEWLIRHHAKIDASSPSGMTPLHVAAENSPAFVQLLIDACTRAQADVSMYVNALNKNERSPLDLATHPETVTLLCQAGIDLARVNAELLYHWIDKFGTSSIHLLQALHDACTEPDQRQHFLRVLHSPLEWDVVSLVHYLRRSPPYAGRFCSDGAAYLRAMDETIEGVKLFLAWGADLHYSTPKCCSAHDFASGYVPDMALVTLSPSVVINNAPAFQRAINTRINTLRQLLGWPAVETAPATQTGKRKRIAGE
ncbi:ankyrin repeat domain-containing protein [Imbroritus primus]|uniref:ankyrin repeat domain-containing protein n=1 Tax=Imbroritus primus TaxID=3058603 RepID=UPI003D1615F9